ncbi:hypothetical protein PCANC_06601 [Puccinia coronata f. sp. avenae]|uniref:Fumarylacetoacetase-like C-terminal domain-containing protein n=1 Tax=Puccinia coronata f. sp. avenae TaxID=200324 RepID=A0A2N5VA68_9BASI|nr:hypothetical protein PCANC_19940 [Puccinia coronata f. sp. avenae]PLW46882.1 hypothetical protein PCANC_06601 [Puccinia coronata f. sp. avenae]
MGFFFHRNYLDHVKELNNQAPSKPFFFLKPTTSYITRGQKIEIPAGINCHHEVELGVIIGNKCRSVVAQNAMKYVAGYTVAIDLTARNLQEDVKRKQLPWASVKGFDTFCPVGKFIQAQDIVDPHQLSIWLKLNGQLKQHSSTGNMIYKIPELISYCSGIMTLEEGDLILTGTPAGVSSISPGDEVEIGLEQKTQGHESQIKVMDQIKFSAIQRPDGLTYDQLRV